MREIHYERTVLVPTGDYQSTKVTIGITEKIPAGSDDDTLARERKKLYKELREEVCDALELEIKLIKQGATK